jgi:PKD repeat protein
MTNKNKLLTLIFLMAISLNQVAGQDTIFASNINKYLSLDGKQLVIKYDLPYSDTTQLFDIILRIYYNDKVIQPNDNSLKGSWGEVKPGVEKVIFWDFPNEFTGAINKVTIGVVARKTIRPIADFDYKVLSKEPPFEVKFGNKSRNADNYSWNFGDLKSGTNNASLLENPVHKYKSMGSYKIGLTAGSTKSNALDNIVKTITVGKGSEQELQKHKKLRTIFLGSAIATAGIGAYAEIKSYNLYNEYKTATGNAGELRKKYKTYGVIGPAVLAVSSACIVEVFLQTKKIRTIEQTLSLNYIPLDHGGVVGLAFRF